MPAITNVDRLLSRLNNIANMELKDTMVKATTVVHGQAKALAPVDTGILASSIHMEVKTQGQTIKGRVYTNVQYAPYVEFGTGIRGTGSYPYEIDGLKLEYKKDWLGMKSKPFMYRALKENEKYIKQLFKEGVHTKLKQNCKGG